MNDNIKDKKEKKRLPLLFTALLVLIFLYMGFKVRDYFTNKPFSTYEVHRGYLSRNNTIMGICLRDEKTFKAAKSGHINFFVGEGQRVGVNTTVYSIDNDGGIYEYIKESRQDLNIDELRQVRDITRDFKRNYNLDFYSRVYDYEIELESYLNNVQADRALKKLKKLNEKTSLGYNKYNASATGNIAFYVDGFEKATLKDAKNIDIENFDYDRHSIRNNDEVGTKDVAYKLLMSEKWQMLCRINEDIYNKLSEIIRNKGNVDKSLNLKVKFLADGSMTNCRLEIDKDNGMYYALLYFTDSAIRFLDYRFMEVELQLKQEVGLKVPVTSSVSKAFYEVPIDFVTRGGNFDEPGVLKKIVSSDNTVSYSFTEIDNIPIKKDVAYIAVSAFEGDAVIAKPEDTSHELRLTDKVNLLGVYNVNKGYTDFNYINVIDKNDQYYVVDDKTSTLKEYDYIILDSTNVEENMIPNS